MYFFQLFKKQGARDKMGKIKNDGAGRLFDTIFLELSSSLPHFPQEVERIEVIFIMKRVGWDNGVDGFLEFFNDAKCSHLTGSAFFIFFSSCHTQGLGRQRRMIFRNALGWAESEDKIFWHFLVVVACVFLHSFMRYPRFLYWWVLLRYEGG